MRPIDADELKEIISESPDDIVDITLIFDLIDDQPTVNEWIDIKSADDLPSDEVLCCNAFGEIMIGYLKKDKVSCMGVTCEDNNTIMFDAVKWMPLPEPYKGDEDK